MIFLKSSLIFRQWFVIKFKHSLRSTIMRTFLFILLFCAVAIPGFSTVVVEEIMARVGDQIITKSDYEAQMQRMEDELKRYYKGDDYDKQLADQKRQLLDFMINQMLLEQKAKELNITVEEDVNAAVKRLREENQFPDDQALDAALKQEGSSLVQLREDFRKRIVQQKILWNYVQGKVNISEEEIKTYYDHHKNEMVTDSSTTIDRYSVTDQSADKEALKQEAQNVLVALRDGKTPTIEEFPHLAVKDTETVAKAELDPRFSGILDATSVGAFTEPVEIPTGWVIIKVDDRKESQPIPFDDARTKIYNTLLQERAEKYQKTFLEDLRKQSYVVVNQTSAANANNSDH
jgi:peptidyl-prolyl cis-trans isomerase SurA